MAVTPKPEKLSSDTLLEEEVKTLKISSPSNSAPNSKAIFCNRQVL
jgi:hypothetical protein